METIKSYTDVEQSEKLAEILPLDSADMWYINGVGKAHFGIWKEKSHDYDDIPCWSFSTLFNVLPKNLNIGRPALNSNYKGHYWVQYYDEYMNPFDFKTICFDNPIDACYEMILKLHELNLL